MLSVSDNPDHPIILMFENNLFFDILNVCLIKVGMHILIQRHTDNVIINLG